MSEASEAEYLSAKIINYGINNTLLIDPDTITMQSQSQSQIHDLSAQFIGAYNFVYAAWDGDEAVRDSVVALSQYVTVKKLTTCGSI